MKISGLILFFFFALSARAENSVDLGLNLIFTQFSSSQVLSLDGEVSLERRKSKSENEANFVYNLGVTHSKSATPDGSGGYLYEDTNQQTANIGYSRRNLYEFDFGINAAQTPSESLKEVGPELAFNYTLSFDKDEKSRADDLDTDAVRSRPVRLRLGAIVDVLNYTETYDATVVNKKRLPSQVSGTESIVQSSYKLQAKLSAGDFRLKAFYVFYRYNRDLPTFLNLLSSAQAVAVNASLFSSTLQGFNVDGEGGSLTYTFSDFWDVAGQAARYVSAIDGSLSCNYQLTVGYTPSSLWRFELAGLHSENEILVDNGGGLDIVYSF